MQSKNLMEIHRSMIKNFLDIMILAKLRNSEPLSGYDLIELIHQKFGMLISPGTIYSVLYSMERKELIKGTLTQEKRTYVLTAKGRDAINAILTAQEEIQGFMRMILNF
ncbi:MAG: PadR family transcriptional regulator [Candidatus Bathyarchaeota archaeon]|nr:PadR family transcriptional regulator [Candidatus Bathyarchaeota archaeon]